MTQTLTGSDSLSLQVTSVGRDGKRRYDPHDKQRVIEACLQPGASVSGVALKAGVNANLLRRWIDKYQEQRDGSVRSRIKSRSPVSIPSPFVPVVEDRCTEVFEASIAQSRFTPARAEPAPRSPTLSRLTAELPNGVTLRLECTGQDASLVSAMIETLGRCNLFLV